MGDSKQGKAVSLAGRVCPTCDETFPADFSVCPRDGTRLFDAAKRPSDRLIGVVLANTFRITNVLGEGGMARVYTAEHVRLGSLFAVKVIHEDIAQSPELLARFEREARAAARIRSDHIVKVIDVLETPDGRPCMVTEILEGEDLKDRLDRIGVMKPKDALPIARQICKAVAAAHRCGVVHRDLKPSNVFLTGDDDDLLVKVLDFGVAKLEDKSELTKTGALVGTLAYMSPEQAKRAADAGPLSDIYTIGAVLYHMLTGQPPYGKDPAINPMILLLNSEPEPPRELQPSIPVGVEAVIQRAMARDPEQRPQTVEELDAELAAFEDAPKPQVPAKPGRRATPAPRRPAPNAAAIARSARRARPAALVVAVAASTVIGLYTAALVAALVASSPESRTGGEQTMITLLGFLAAGALGWLHVRALKQRWRSLPAVQKIQSAGRRALGAGLVCMGALELGARGFYAVQKSPEPSQTAWTIRLILAGVVAIVALAWPRLFRREPDRKRL